MALDFLRFKANCDVAFKENGSDGKITTESKRQTGRRSGKIC